MALKITLKPDEKLILGGAIIKNGGSKAELLIENNVTILREKDIMLEDEVNSPCKRIYFVIQLMYIEEGGLEKHYKLYWKLVSDVVKAAPSQNALLREISELILKGNYYKALKLARKLIDFEQEVIKNALETKH
jgi:flagellar protein FlbT